MASTIKVDTIENVAGSGNVSLGSGHNLVVPGDLTVDTNTLYVDSTNNRVGIGTSSPLAPLNTSYIDASRNDLLLLTNRNTGGYGPWINFYGDYNGGYSFAKIGAENDSTGGSMRFHTANTSGTSIEQMRIDNSGRVTMPYQPAFSANRTAGDYTSHSVIVWNSVVYNQGNHYDSSNGRFTAPVAGVYQFNVMGSVTGGAANVAIHQLRINGSATNTVWPIATASSNHISYANSFVVKLNASDYTEIMSATGSTTWYGTGNVHNHYSGFLVG